MPHRLLLYFFFGSVLLQVPAPLLAREAGGASRPAVRGVNYIPTYADSADAIWADFDEATVDRELGWAADLGFNALRVALSYEAFRKAPRTFLDRFDVFLRLAEDRGLRVMPVLYDAWGTAPEDDLGPERPTLAETYARIEANPAPYRMTRESLQKFQTVALELLPDRRVPRSRDPAVLLWCGWRASPPPERIAPQYRAVYRNYVAQVVRAHAEDETILAWDIMNNPAAGDMMRLRKDIGEAHRFVAEMIEAARGAGASQPITVSFSEGYGSMGPLVNHLDALSAHSHSDAPRETLRAVLELKEIGKERPVFLTWTGGVLLPATARDAGEESQERRVRGVIDAVERQDAGWFIWHLIEGEGPCPWDGLLRRDGALKPAAAWLKRELRRMR